MKLIQCVTTFSKKKKAPGILNENHIKQTKYFSIIFYLPGCRSLVGIIFSYETQAGFSKWLKSFLSEIEEEDA